MTRLDRRAGRHCAPDGTLPLINIVLLLVLVFMMAGTIASPLPSGWVPVTSASAQPEDKSGGRLELDVGPQGGVLHRARPLSAPGLEALLSAAAAEGRMLVVRADARAPAAKVLALFRQARRAGIMDGHLLTIEARS